MQKIISIFLITFTSYSLYSQESYNQLDSVGERHGSWKKERELYCKKTKNDDCKIIISGVEKGMYYHGKKTGFWTILDNKGKLFKQEFFQNDILKLVIDYKKNRILSIAIVECIQPPSNKQNIIGEYKVIEVTNFNKVGTATKRTYKCASGETITEKY